MSKHTPGPWHFRVDPIHQGQYFIRVQSYGFAPLATVCDSAALSTEGNRANARLIAAAPELLDELIEQDKFLGVLAGTVPLSEKDTHRRIAMHRESVRAAIAKATSRE